MDAYACYSITNIRILLRVWLIFFHKLLHSTGTVSFEKAGPCNAKQSIPCCGICSPSRSSSEKGVIQRMVLADTGSGAPDEE